MAERTEFHPGITFERLAYDDDAYYEFREYLIAAHKAKWNITKAEEVLQNKDLGIMMTMVFRR